jgi:DNA polymerase-3 subunit delta
MPQVSKDLLRDELRRGELRPAYIVHGQETYLRDGAVKYLAQQVFSKDDFRDLNETTFNLSTDPDVLREAIAAAEQLPMMASRRLVKVTGLRISATGVKDTVVEDHEDLLRSYLSTPSPTSVVVFVADELNGNRKMSKLLKDLCAAVEFKSLEETELVQWVAKEFSGLGAKAAPQVVRQLIERVGSDLHRLSNEINKVAAAALPSREITSEIVEQLVPAGKELDNFAFTKHLVAGRGGKAFALLRKMLDDGAEPVAMIGTLAYTYRQLMAVKALMELGVDRRQIVSQLRMRYSDQEPFLAAARRTSVVALTGAIKAIAAADLAIKTSIGGSTSGPRMQIEMLAAKLARIPSN